MKYVINQAYGGYSLPEDFCGIYGIEDPWDDYDLYRKDDRLIKYVEEHPSGDLKVMEIPDNATDWERLEYDGMESIIVVIDGKIHYL